MIGLGLTNREKYADGNYFYILLIIEQKMIYSN